MAIALSHHHHHSRRFLSSGGAAMWRLMSRWLRPSYLLFLLLPLLAAAGCGRSATDRELDRVDAVMESEPELADAMLDSISPGRGADRARHALYRLVATGKLTGAVDNDSLLTLVADRYCTPDAPASRDAMIANFYRGIAKIQREETVEAVGCLTAAEDMAAVVPDSAYITRIYSYLAYLYSLDYNSKKVSEYSKMTLDYTSPSDSAGMAAALYGMAKGYAMTENDSMAWQYYGNALRYAEATGDYDMAAAILSEYGVSKVRRHDYEAGVRMLSQADSISGSLPPEAQGAYAYALNETGHRGQCDEIMERLGGNSDPEAEMSYLYYSSLIAASDGDYRTAFERYRTLNASTESALDRQLAQNVSGSASMYYNSMLDHTRLQYEAQRSNRHLLLALWTVSTLLLLAMIFLAWLLYRRYRATRRESAIELDRLRRELTEAGKKIKAHQDEYDRMLRQADSIRETAKCEMDGASETLREAGETSNRARETMKEAVALSGTVTGMLDGLARFYAAIESSGTVRNTEKAIISTHTDHLNRILFDKGKEPVIYRYINLIHNNLIDNVRHDLPAVKPENMRVLALTVLGFSTLAISQLLNIRYQSAAQRKSRLKKDLTGLQAPSHPGGYAQYFQQESTL